MKALSNKLFQTVFRNGFEYGASSITVLIDNAPFISLTSLSYSEKVMLENLFGLGNQAVARGVGNYETTGSMTIRKSEIGALQIAAKAAGDPAGSLGSILPFQIVVTFIRPGGTGGTTDVLYNCQFTGNELNSSTGQTSLDVTLELVFTHVEWGKL